MLKTTRIIDQSLMSIIDDKYVAEVLKDVEGNIGIAFACTKGDWRKDEKWKKKGWVYYQIAMPYEKVAAMEPAEVREWMLQLAKERLGLVKKGIIQAQSFPKTHQQPQL